jgi:hypothetical protein
VSTLAASVAVVCAVAMTNSAALSEAAATTVDAAPIVVPSPESSATPRPSQTPSVSPTASPLTPDPPAQAEVVEAPAPVTVPAEAPAGGTTPMATPAEEQAAIEQAHASGSWEDARAWAAERGWSEERIDRWIERLQNARDERPGNAGGGGEGQLTGPLEPTGDSVQRLQQSTSQTLPSERPADAGASADRAWQKPPAGSKKDQSRVPPDRRD